MTLTAAPGKSATRAQWLVVVAIAVALVLGFVAARVTVKDSPVRQYTVGKIVLSNTDGTAGCVQPDGGGKKFCGPFYANGRVFRTGDHVRATFVWLTLDSGTKHTAVILDPVGVFQG